MNENNNKTATDLLDEYDGKQLREVKSNRVKTIRERLGLTQSKLAKDLGLESDSIIKKIESGAKGLSLDIALKICEAYDVSLDYIFCLSPYMNEEEKEMEHAFEKLFDVELIQKKYVDKKMIMYDVDILSLNANDYLIQYLYGIKKAEKQRDNKEISDEEFKFKVKKLKEAYYEAMTVNGKDKSKHYLLPVDIGEKLLHGEIWEEE